MKTVGFDPTVQHGKGYTCCTDVACMVSQTSVALDQESGSAMRFEGSNNLNARNESLGRRFETELVVSP